MNFNLNKNLILQKEFYQEKVLLELSKNVLVNMIIFFMQLNKYKKMKDLLILMKYKLYKILKIIKI